MNVTKEQALEALESLGDCASGYPQSVDYVASLRAYIEQAGADAARWRAFELRTSVGAFNADGRWSLLVRLPFAHSFVAAIDAAIASQRGGA